MKRSIMKTVALAAIGAGLVPPTAAHAADSVPQGVPGYLDPATGVFTSAPIRPIPASASTSTGTIKIVITLSIESAIPAGAPVECSVTIFPIDRSFSNSATASVAAVRSGKSATCTLTIPYNWTLASAKDLVDVSFSASVGNVSGKESLERITTHSFPAFTVPKNGATTTLDLADSL